MYVCMYVCMYAGTLTGCHRTSTTPRTSARASIDTHWQPSIGMLTIYVLYVCMYVRMVDVCI